MFYNLLVFGCELFLYRGLGIFLVEGNVQKEEFSYELLDIYIFGIQRNKCFGYEDGIRLGWWGLVRGLLQ